MTNYNSAYEQQRQESRDMYNWIVQNVGHEKYSKSPNWTLLKVDHSVNVATAIWHNAQDNAALLMMMTMMMMIVSLRVWCEGKYD